jgi:hypothetical protein
MTGLLAVTLNKKIPIQDADLDKSMDFGLVAFNRKQGSDFLGIARLHCGLHINPHIFNE